MRIDPKAPSLPLAPGATVRRGPAPSRFNVEGQGTAQKTGAQAASPLASVDALLALQGEADPGERRRRSLRRGHDLLDALDGLKASLLSGRVPATELRGLAGRLAERNDASGDPQLDDLLGHIELRAKVELAKLGRA